MLELHCYLNDAFTGPEQWYPQHAAASTLHEQVLRCARGRHRVKTSCQTSLSLRHVSQE